MATPHPHSSVAPHPTLARSRCPLVHIHTRAHTHTRIHTHTHTHTHLGKVHGAVAVEVSACTHTRARAHTHTCIHTRTHTLTRTRTHTHTHTRTPTPLLPRQAPSKEKMRKSIRKLLKQSDLCIINPPEPMLTLWKYPIGTSGLCSWQVCDLRYCSVVLFSWQVFLFNAPFLKNTDVFCFDN